MLLDMIKPQVQNKIAVSLSLPVGARTPLAADDEDHDDDGDERHAADAGDDDVQHLRRQPARLLFTRLC